MNKFDGSSVLITGGLGFIGSHVTRELVHEGAQVTIVDNQFSGGGANMFNIHDIKEQIDLEIVDIRDKKVHELIEGKDFVFHLAAQTGHKDSMISPQEDIDINVRGSLNVIEGCRKSSSDPVIIFAGTRGQYGKIKNSPVSETHKLVPCDVNGVSKQAAESLMNIYHEVYGLKTISLRLTNTYGPGQQMKNARQGFLPWFVRLALDNQTIEIFGEGNQLRDFNYVSDVIDAILFCSKSEAARGEVFNVGSGNPVSILEIAQSIVDSCGSGKINRVPFPKEQKKIEIGDYIADISKIQAMGWQPKVGIQEGLKSMIDYYKKNKEQYW